MAITIHHGEITMSVSEAERERTWFGLGLNETFATRFCLAAPRALVFHVTGKSRCVPGK